MEREESISTKVQPFVEGIHPHQDGFNSRDQRTRRQNYLSTLAVLQLDSILTGARKVSVKKPKPGNANQKPFERIMIMEYELTGIGKIKMTVGVRRRTLEKVQYCITAISSE